MPRFSSQRTRQAILVLGAPLDPELLPESIELFDQDGNPISLSSSGGAGSIPTGGLTGQVLAKTSDSDYEVEWIDPPSSGMIWKGAWDSSVAYSRNDVVTYEDIDGIGTFIFTEDVAAAPPSDPPLPDFDGRPITMAWDSAVSPLAVTLDASSPLSDVVYNANSPYVAIAFKKVSGGTIEIRSAPQEGTFRDLLANFYKLSGSSWSFVTQNDDSAGLGHPRILTSQAANTFLFVLTTTNGADPTTQYGTSLITLGPGNTAVYQAMHFGTPAFPSAKVIQIG